MSAQFPPSAPQRRHWYAYVSGAVPLHVPRVPVSVSPSRALPVTCGGVSSTGGAGATVLVAAVLAAVAPAALRAVTTARIVCPVSSPVSAYVVPVAPAMSVQFAPPPSHRRHW